MGDADVTGELEVLLSRPGLDPGVRLLIVAKAAIWLADWDRLAACVTAARGRLRMERAQLEETLLQAVLFYGFPRCVSAFEVLDRDWPVRSAPRGGGLPPEQQRAAGQDLFDSIYAKNSGDVHAMLRGYHGEFHDFVLEAAYGRILTRPGLDPRRRELLAVGALAVMGQVPQLVAHARGALTFGADQAELREALISVLGDVSTVSDHLRRISGGRDAGG